MTLKDFNMLDEPEQIIVISNFGTEIGKRADKAHKYILYQIDSFYVEKEFDIKGKTLKRIKPFNNLNLLNPYLNNIDISEIQD